MTYHQQRGRAYGHVTVLKFCRFCDAALLAGWSAIAELGYLYYWPTYTKCRGQTSNGRWRLSSSVVCNTRICNVTPQGASRVEPFVLRPVRTTHCFTCATALEWFRRITQWFWESIGSSEVTTLWRYTNIFIIIIINNKWCICLAEK